MVWRGSVYPYTVRTLPAIHICSGALAQTGQAAPRTPGQRAKRSCECAEIEGKSMKVIKAIYNFIVGDMVILIGILALVVILSLFRFIPALNPLEVASGPLLIVGVLGVLLGSLSREIRPKR